MPKAETERCQILRQIDSVLRQQVKVRPPKVEIDSNLSSVFKKNTQILDDSYLEKKIEENDLNLNDLNLNEFGLK